MKHGDKAKSKAASKASGKKSSSKGVAVKGAKSSKAVQSVKQAPRKTEKPAQTSKPQAGGNGKPRPRAADEAPGFSNPIVANAFKRAIKKYPNAFRRLTD